MYAYNMDATHTDCVQKRLTWEDVSYSHDRRTQGGILLQFSYSTATDINHNYSYSTAINYSTDISYDYSIATVKLSTTVQISTTTTVQLQ